VTLGCNVRFFIFVLMLCKVNLENNSLFLFKVGADKSDTAYEGIAFIKVWKVLFFPRVEYWELYSPQCFHVCLIIAGQWDSGFFALALTIWTWCCMVSLFSLLLQVIQSIRWDTLKWLLLRHRNLIMCVCTGLSFCQCQKLATKDLQLFSIFLPMWNELSHLYVQLAKKKKNIHIFCIVCNNITYYIVFYILSWGYVLVSSWMHFFIYFISSFFKWTVNCQHIILWKKHGKYW